MRTRRVYNSALALCGTLVVGSVLLLHALGALHGTDLSSINWRFAIRGSIGAPKNVVVVGIDASTFSYLDARDPEHAHFPFQRRLDARVITNLKRDGARVIAYDEQFTERTDPIDDNALILAIRAAPRVVLATTEVAAGGRTRVLGGGNGLAFSRATAAEAQFPLDSDGRIRRLRAQLLDLVSFPVATAQLSLGRSIRFPGGRNASALIDFRGPPGTVPIIPYWRVLAGTFPAGTVRGKIVVVGATESILQDRHDTAAGVQMSGPEIQANAIDTVLRQFPLSSTPGWLNALVIILLGAIAPITAMRLDAFRGAGITLAALALFAVGCQLAFNGGLVVQFIYGAIAASLSVALTLMLYGVRVVFEREHARDAFARFVPESVVNQVLAQADGLRLGGVRCEATVLFSDLRGFTSFAEKRAPDETLEILNRYLTSMSEAILEHGGTLVSYIGDGIMAVFGAPIAQPDHAQRAVDTARGMLARLDEFNGWLQAHGYEPFKMGIGLNTGQVMSGNVGSERRLEYTTIGDTTNTASRVEGMTKGTPHQLYIADTTYAQLTDPSEDLISVGEFDVRGRSTKIAVWTIAPQTKPESDHPDLKPSVPVDTSTPTSE